ncbi:cyclic di-GMP phosphodiesterase Gmr [mine drainage metagenome]|uniref:Cyclic di-GMP phosphodiesterase Gmr n=1 Tax=mine drainage metagenome TaxID=410659 RepID=A0A1J5S0M6_9ZZZZ
MPMSARLDRLTEGELRKIMLEQQAILDNATIGILFSRNRQLVSSNALCAEMFGYAPGELIGLPALSLYPSAEAYQELGREAAPVLSSGAAFHAEIQYKRKDGSLFWCRVSAKAVDPHRTQDGTIWIMEDVSEDRVLREALEQSIRELGTIFETAVIGIVVLRSRRIARCNRRMEELFGYAPGEMLGQSTRLWYFTEEDYAGPGAAAYLELAQGNLHQREQLFRRKDGSSFWGRLSARAFDPTRPEAGAVGLFEDITEKRQAEAQVRAALEQQEMIFNNAAVAIMFVRNRVIQRCNRRLEDMFGYSEGELVGNSTLMLFPTVGEYDAFGASAAETIRRGDTVIHELRVKRKDGSRFWLRATGRKTDASGPMLDVIWIFEDVTERHQAEEDLARARDELELRVAERTAELASTNEQLQEEIFERLQAEQRIWHLAHHDALTGLPNRSLLLDRLDQALTQASRTRHRLAVIFLDLDRFKSINDTLGHAVGDQLLKHVAERLRAAVRAVDTVSRLGGDEFVMVLHEIDRPDDAVLVAEKVIAALAQAVEIEGHRLLATPSIGISIYPDDGDEAYALMKNADTAMYHAKASGRNNFQFFTAKMNEEAARLFNLEHRLRGAIERGEFLLYYQPLIDRQKNAVCGMEALVRWQDPERGLISPAEFVPVAEETGLIVPLGLWVLREACRQNSAWQAQGYPPLPVSVNISPRQFRERGLVDAVRAALAETGQPPGLLELEITESTLMHDADETLDKLRQIAAMGVRLAVDDFGTGYSSLSYLKRFPVHKLKIDQSFVRDLGDDRDDAAIVAAIIALARALGLKVLAEGVETDAQFTALANFGCLEFQGFLFSRPLAPDNAEAIFRPPTLPLRA